MKFDIVLKEKVSRSLYSMFCLALYRKILKEIRQDINYQRYDLRQEEILKYNLIQWDTTPRNINIKRYIEDCVVLTLNNGIYSIGLDENAIVRYSTTKVSTLVRIIEYGTEHISPHPYVIPLLKYYAENYEKLFRNFRTDKKY